MAIEENKVTLVGVNSASVTFSNEANVEKQYKVNANVNVSNGKNIDSFDGQTWDMFCNLVDLVIDEMKQDIEFWKQVYTKIKE